MRKITPLLLLTQQFASITRNVAYRDGHLENDAEHSYQLAMLSWAANRQYNLGLSDEKLLKLALIHDFVEIFAGDTDSFDKKRTLDKKEREKKSLLKLKREYPQYEDIWKEISEYEKKDSPEAVLVNIIDKFIPDINAYFSKYDYHHVRKIDISQWEKWLFSKIDYDTLNPKFKKLVDESLKDMKTRYKEVFYDPKTDKPKEEETI